jgi:hypothetical protein
VSTKLNAPSTRFPFNITGKVEPEVENAIRWTFNGFTNHEQAFDALNTKVNSLATTVSTATSTVTTVTSSVTAFPGIGTVSDQSGLTTYTPQISDNGALVIFNDASPVAVTLNSLLSSPYFFFTTNYGAGTATFTPTSGTINGVASFALPKNYLAVVVFDGTNWKTSALLVIPANTPAVASEWLASYNAATGAFTQTQPAFTDISGTVAASQLPTPTVSTLGGVEAVVAVSHKWINAINTSGVPQLSQPAVGDVTGAAPSANPTFTGTVTAPVVNLTATQTPVAASGSGTVTFSQPEQGSSYKKVVIYCAAATGTASYVFPVAYSFTPMVLSQSLAATVTTISTTGVTVTGSASTGFIVLEGY